MRVLTVGNMYPPHSLGGYEVTWCSSVEQLRARGHEVDVLTTSFAAPAAAGFRDPPHVHRDLAWYWHDHSYPRIGLARRLALELRNARVLEDRVRRLKPEVIAWWAMGGMSLSMIERVRRAGIPAVGMVADDWMLYGPQVDAWMRTFLGGRMRRLSRPIARVTGVPTTLNLGAAAEWLFVSQPLLADARDAWALPRTGLAHPGVDPERFPAVAQHPWRWRLAYVGRIDPRKGIEAAVRALALLPVEATLTVTGAGDAKHLAELAALARTLGLSGRVTFQSRPRTEIHTVYAQADALLFPVTWREPWGLVPLEAMAVGRPVVTSGRGGQRRYVREGENCLIAEPAGGADALAGAIGRLAGDPELRERLRRGGIETAGRFTERAYNEAIEAALKRARPPGSGAGQP